MVLVFQPSDLTVFIRLTSSSVHCRLTLTPSSVWRLINSPSSSIRCRSPFGIVLRCYSFICLYLTLSFMFFTAFLSPLSSFRVICCHFVSFLYYLNFLHINQVTLIYFVTTDFLSYQTANFNPTVSDLVINSKTPLKMWKIKDFTYIYVVISFAYTPTD